MGKSSINLTNKNMLADTSLPRINPVDYYLLREFDFVDLLVVAFSADPEPDAASAARLQALIAWGVVSTLADDRRA